MKKAILFLIMFTLYGCDQTAEAPVEPATEAKISPVGTVLETIDVDTYTYTRLDLEGTEVWIASNPVWVSEGDKIRFSDAILMKDFHSKVLDRTFSDILFVSNVELVEATATDTSAAQAAAPQASDPHANLKAQAKGNPQPVVAQAVDVQALEGGMTIATIFVEREQIEGQEVSLRAKVIKFSPNVLGKNWITLQDGTGTAPDDKLVVTSSETVEIGDEVIVKGKIIDWGKEDKPLINLEGKGSPIVIMDFLGDAREEVVVQIPGELRIYSTTIPATDRRICLMQDPLYRLDVCIQAMGYTQCPMTTKCLSAE